MKPRHSAEQSTVRVNKAEMTGKRGFGVLAGLETSSGFKKAITEPVESGEAVTVVAAPVPAEILVAKVEVQEMKLESVLETVNESRIVERNGLNIHISDPGDAAICDSCQ